MIFSSSLSRVKFASVSFRRKLTIRIAHRSVPLVGMLAQTGSNVSDVRESTPWRPWNVSQSEIGSHFGGGIK